MLSDFPAEYAFVNWSDHSNENRAGEVKATSEKKRKQHVYEYGDVILLDPGVPASVSKKLYRQNWQKCKVIIRHNGLVCTVRSLATRKNHKMNIKRLQRIYFR